MKKYVKPEMIDNKIVFIDDVLGFIIGEGSVPQGGQLGKDRDDDFSGDGDKDKTWTDGLW